MEVLHCIRASYARMGSFFALHKTSMFTFSSKVLTASEHTRVHKSIELMTKNQLWFAAK